MRRGGSIGGIARAIALPAAAGVSRYRRVRNRHDPAGHPINPMRASSSA